MQRQGEHAARAQLSARRSELGGLIGAAQNVARVLERELCEAVNFIRHARDERDAIDAALNAGGVQ